MLRKMGMIVPGGWSFGLMGGREGGRARESWKDGGFWLTCMQCFGGTRECSAEDPAGET